mmetsp:Transcript_7121/g.23602  ORF Transcript_7121/g.23602 Transcript_7121/m.23602 type:complete len:201 (-) Transcript_7121:568-1170(-)
MSSSGGGRGTMDMCDVLCSICHLFASASTQSLRDTCLTTRSDPVWMIRKKSWSLGSPWRTTSDPREKVCGMSRRAMPASALIPRASRETSRKRGILVRIWMRSASSISRAPWIVFSKSSRWMTRSWSGSRAVTVAVRHPPPPETSAMSPKPSPCFSFANKTWCLYGFSILRAPEAARLHFDAALPSFAPVFAACHRSCTL